MMVRVELVDCLSSFSFPCVPWCAVSTSVSKVAKVSHEDTTSVALTEADNGEVGDKVVENDGERALPQAPVPGASLVLAPPSSLSTTKSDMAVEGDAPVTSAAAITTTSAVDQAKKICDEIRLSSLVSDEDKVAVDKFFRDKGNQSNAYLLSPRPLRPIFSPLIFLYNRIESGD